MKRIRINILIPGIVLLLIPCFSLAADDSYVPVADYWNTDTARDTVGARVVAILHEHKIDSVETETGGVTFDVPASRADEARQILAKAIKSEGLHLTLLVLKGKRAIVVTPDSVLESKKTP